MDKSIENIWKDGFLKSKAIVIPKVNDLYNRKSVHIVDKFTRMTRNNVWGIVAFSTLLFIGACLAGAVLAGMIGYGMMLSVAFVAYKDLQSLKSIDKGQNSYTYLTTLKEWIDHSIERYGKLYRLVYPVLILTFYFGIWFSDAFVEMREKVMAHTDDMVFGVHLYTTLFILVFAALLSIFSKKIHRADVQAIYGGILNKLAECIADMESLRKED